MPILFDTYDITFAEVPDEISLTFAITNCQGKCPGCHSAHLRQNIGSDLLASLPSIIKKYERHISCVCLLGEGNSEPDLLRAIEIIKSFEKRVCLYSGRDDIDEIPSEIMEQLDYIKIGSYKQELGGLTSRTTNQRMYRLEKGMPVEDITFRFRQVS